MKAIVIGSGMAGLTSAATLAQAGHQVMVFEQFEQAGGVTGRFEKDGFRWDLGQLLIEGLAEHEPVGRVLAALGVLGKIQTRLEDRGYVFPDFELRKPAEYQGLMWRIERLKQLFPQDAAGLDRYWQDFVRFTRLMTIGRRLEAEKGKASWAWKARLYRALLPLLGKLNWSAQKLMDHYFTSGKLKLVFTSILADFATPPKQFLGLGVFALNPENVYDKRIPAAIGKNAEMLYHYSVLGGISRLADALAERIVKLGGEIRTNTAVQKLLIEDRRVTGVVDVAGRRWDADVVVASGGARELFLELVGEEHLPAEFVGKVKTIPLMCSVFMLHLGLEYDPSPYLHGVATYYYGTYDIDGVMNELKEGIYHEGKAGFVVHVPTLHTPEMAPPACHAMTIYTVAPDRLKEGSWSERKEEYAEKLLDYAEAYIPGLREHSRVRVILTPEDFRQRLRVDPHAFGGLAPVMGAWRAPHKTPIEGLGFIGAQSESGGGVNNVIRTSYQVAKRMLAEKGK